MNAFRNLLVFSDLDGTLLDHKTYSWSAAAPALDTLRNKGAGVILTSSKTAAEIHGLRADIGFEEWPSIVENGGGLLEAGKTAMQTCSVYRDLRNVLASLPVGFRGFGDMSVEEIRQRTGLSPTAAKQAKQRRFSEPGVWEGDLDELEVFVEAASAAGLTAQRGGRFTTLSFGGTKADRVAELIARFQPGYTIVLGDAPNDIEMLNLADQGVIIANPAFPELPHMPGEETGQIRRTHVAGPQGWADAVLEILDDLSQVKETKNDG